MLRSFIRRMVRDRHRTLLKQSYYRTQMLIANLFFSYSVEDLKQALIQVGVRKGDTVFVHSSFRAASGFRGTAPDIVNCLLEAVGGSGNLLMPSMSYMTSTREYLKKNLAFNVKKTPSKMGLLTELFRRKEGVLRSLHPAHPILASGKDAAWIVEGHEQCPRSCGKNTPFDKFRMLRGKTLFFDAPFDNFTFIHFIEDLIKDRLGFQLYDAELMPARLIDWQGVERIIPTAVFSAATVRFRKPEVLEEALKQRNQISKIRIGRTLLMLVSAEDAIACTEDMLRRNRSFHQGVLHEG